MSSESSERKQKHHKNLLEIVEIHKSPYEVYPGSDISVLQPNEEKHSNFGKNSTIVAASHFVKALLSPTILVMPSAFKSGGLLFSVFGHVFLVLIISYNIKTLIDSADYLSKREKLDVQTYDQVVFVSFSTCSAKTKRFAKSLRLLVNLLFVITHLDALTIFIIFIAKNALYICSFYFPDHEFLVQHFIFFQMLPLMIMNTVRHLKYLSPFSIISSAILAVGASISFHYFVHENTVDVWDRNQIGDYSIIRFFSMVIFSQSGISIALTIKSSMKHPHKFLGIPGVYCLTLMLSTCIYVPFGYLGYLKFGEETKPSVMLNFPNRGTEPMLVKGLVIVSVALTAPIAFYVMFNVFWNNFVRHMVNETNQLAIEYFFRAAFVIAPFVLAMTFPFLGAMIVLKGALLHSQLEVIYPPIIEFVTYYPQKGYGRGYFRLIKAIFISFLGVFFCISGTVVGVWDLILEM